MRERVAETTHHYCMFAAGQIAGIAVSGGADSVALFHLLREMAPRLGISLRVLHFDHQLRGRESDEDRIFVQNLAAAHGIPCDTANAAVRRIARKSGENLEQAAREARYGFFREQLAAGKVHRVALGHTLSDQAETVLYRFLRGSGLAGLAGIYPVTEDGFVRPLLDLARPEIEAWLRSEGHVWREDPSNRDLAFDRNRIRHELLPALERDWNPNLANILARVAVVARDEEAFWKLEIDRLANGVVQEHRRWSGSSGPPDGPVTRPSASLQRRPMATQQRRPTLLHCTKLAQCSLAHQRRLVRRAIRQSKGDLRQIDFFHVEQVLNLAVQNSGAGGVDLPGLLVRRSFEWIRLAPPDAWPSAAEYRFSLSPPAKIQAPGSNSIICLALEPAIPGNPVSSGGYNKLGEGVLDWTRIGGGFVELRNWTPGDRIQLPGERRARKVHDLFQSERIPSWDRAGWPVVAKGGRILWLKGFGAASEYLPSRRTGMILRIREENVT